MPTVFADFIEHKRGMNTTLQMQHSKHAGKEARHLQSLLRSSRDKGHKYVFNAGSQMADTGTRFMSAIQHPLLGIVTDAKRILEGVDFSQRLLNAQFVPSHVACTPAFQARAPRQALRAEPPLPDPIKIARHGTETSLASHSMENCLPTLQHDPGQTLQIPWYRIHQL